MNQFVGAPLGGLLAAATLTAAFAASSGAYLAAALCLTAIAGTLRPARIGSAGQPSKSMRADIAEGLRFVWHNPLLRALGLMLGLTNLALSTHAAVFVLFAVAPGPMRLSRAGYGLLLASSAIGGVGASWVVAWLERVVGRARCLFGAIAVFAAARLRCRHRKADRRGRGVRRRVAQLGSGIRSGRRRVTVREASLQPSGVFTTTSR
jgi:Na+/melibiose symporter-like transporter